MIRYDDAYFREHFSKQYPKVWKEAEDALERLVSGSGKGSEYLGWINLPDASAENLVPLMETAKEIHDSGDLLVCVGIGGSYLGAKALIHALYGNSHRIRFIGHHLSPMEWDILLKELRKNDYYINVISKSGTTTEPGIAFRILREHAENKYGQTAAERILVTTDANKGALRLMADEKGYRHFIIPDDVGGRFSLLTPVGLLPVLSAGADIDQIIRGAVTGFKHALSSNNENIALRYAVARSICYRDGKGIELLSSFEPRLHFLLEWWKQLYGESEGKDGKGLFPASVDFTTDLHSMGQWIQDGVRSIFETFLVVDHYHNDIEIPFNTEDHDGLNYLAGRTMSFINRKAYEATSSAHADGGVPVSAFYLDYPDEEHIVKLCVIFQVAVAVSGYMLNINPFDQPGVEAYKKNMFSLLGKPGY